MQRKDDAQVILGVVSREVNIMHIDDECDDDTALVIVKIYMVVVDDDETEVVSILVLDDVPVYDNEILDDADIVDIDEEVEVEQILADDITVVLHEGDADDAENYRIYLDYLVIMVDDEEVGLRNVFLQLVDDLLDVDDESEVSAVKLDVIEHGIDEEVEVDDKIVYDDIDVNELFI